MRMHRTRIYTALVATFSAVAIFVFQQSNAASTSAVIKAEPAPALVEVRDAVSTVMAPQQWVPGTVTSRHDARIASGESGRVIEIAEVGARVQRGDVLARIDDEALKLALQQAEASLQRAESRRVLAERQAERMASITARSSLAEAQLDQIRADRDERRQESVQARAVRDDAHRRWRDASVRAPFSGTVAERFVSVGEHLGTGAAVLRLVDTVELEITARAPMALAPVLQVGTEVSVRGNPDVRTAKLRAVVPIGDSRSRQLEVRVLLPASAYSVGSAVEVGLPSANARTAIAISRDALVLSKDGTYVFRINADNKAERLSVATGATQDDLVEIRGELVSGDRLVTRGAERLQAGQAVTVAARL